MDDKNFNKKESEEKESEKKGQLKETTTELDKNRIFYRVLMGIGIGLILISLVSLGRIFYRYYSEQERNHGLIDSFVTKDDTSQKNKKKKDNSSEESEKETPWYELYQVDLAGLKEVNSDVVGWIAFENEEISYPVVHCDNDYTYLNTAVDGSYAASGAIFMETLNNVDFNDSHTIIFGHNMKDKSMFGRLHNYNKDNYYEDHQYFQIIVEDKVYRYQVFAYEDISESSYIYDVSFTEGEAFDEFVRSILRASFIDTDVAVTGQDKVITLSTCSAEGRRLVVHGVRVDTYSYEKN